MLKTITFQVNGIECPAAIPVAPRKLSAGTALTWNVSFDTAYCKTLQSCLAYPYISVFSSTPQVQNFCVSQADGGKHYAQASSHSADCINFL